MGKQWSVVWLTGLFLSGLLAACQPGNTPPSPAVPEETGLANPASVYCDDLGYTLDIREDEDGGQHGVCIFPDGSECEEWAFFRGECGADKTYCARQGYTLEVRDGVPTCVFPDGSSCPDVDYLHGECGPEGG